MKRLLPILLILCLLLSSCANSGDQNNPSNDSNAQSTEGTSPDVSGGAATGELAVGGVELTQEFTVTPGKDLDFILQSGYGVMSVNIPDGALESGSLSVSAMSGLPEGVLCAGFYAEDKASTGEHVVLNAPAIITYWQAEPISEDVTIVLYSDDLKQASPVPCWRLEAEGYYGLMAEVDSFSGYGVASSSGSIDFEIVPLVPPKPDKPKESFTWRLEAENHTIRYLNIMGSESVDLSFFIRADSRRTAEEDNNYNNIPSVYYGRFDAYALGISEEKAEFQGEELPMVVSMHTGDINLRLRMIPKFKWVKKVDKSTSEKDDLHIVPYVPQKPQGRDTDFEIIPLVPQKTSAIGESHTIIPLAAQKPQVQNVDFEIVPLVPSSLVFDGYVGWGTANMKMIGDSALGAAVGGDGINMGSYPITVRVKGGVATVRFVYPGMGAVELKGRFYGVGKTEVNAPPSLHDPAVDYSPGKPESLPDTPTGDPLDGLEGISEGEGGRVTQTIPGGGAITIIFPDMKEEDKEDLPALDSFMSMWGEYIQYDFKDLEE